MIIVELSSGCRRQPTVGGADSSVGPVTHIIPPDHSLQLFHSVVLRFVLTAVEQLFFPDFRRFAAKKQMLPPEIH